VPTWLPFQHAGNILLEVAKLGFDHLAHLFLHLGRDFVDRLAVGNSLLDTRLSQGGLDGDGFLDILGSHHRLGAGGGVFQNGAGRFQIQGRDTLGGSQGGVGNSQQGINGGLVGGGRAVRD
jgi:hypothetical protein